MNAYRVASNKHVFGHTHKYMVCSYGILNSHMHCFIHKRSQMAGAREVESSYKSYARLVPNADWSADMFNVSRVIHLLKGPLVVQTVYRLPSTE